MADEAHLLSIAKAALSEGRAIPARVALKQHASRYPAGLLAEERDALIIRVLLHEGDRPAARAALTAFANRFPKSVFLSPLLAAFRESIP